jgi:hypothetical protein
MGWLSHHQLAHWSSVGKGNEVEELPRGSRKTNAVP